MVWRLRRMVPPRAVTTHAKTHAQQQLARDLEVERQKPFLHSRQGDNWVPEQQYNQGMGLRRVVPAAAVTTHAKPHAQQQLARDPQV